MRGAADASSVMASRRKTLSRETFSDMQCRTLDTPAPKSGRNGPTTPNSFLATSLSTSILDAAGRSQGTDHRADRVTQQTPRAFTCQITHCSTFLGLLAARRASRRAIRALLFAAAARRQTCTTGASTTVGEDCNANATRRGGRPRNTDATGRLTEPDATQRFRRLRNADATGRAGTLLDATTGRGYEATRDNSVTPGTPAAVGVTWVRSAITPPKAVDKSATD